MPWIPPAYWLGKFTPKQQQELERIYSELDAVAAEQFRTAVECRYQPPSERTES